MTFTSQVAIRDQSTHINLGRAAPLALLAALGTLGSPVGRADETSASGSQLSEVVITAQKREQNLEEVPIAVIALSGQQLQDAGVTDLKNMTALTPGLTVTSTTSENSTTARIRGIGTVGDNVGLESSVGVVIDGVYRPRNGVGFGDHWSCHGDGHRDIGLDHSHHHHSADGECLFGDEELHFVAIAFIFHYR